MYPTSELHSMQFRHRAHHLTILVHIGTRNYQPQYEVEIFFQMIGSAITDKPDILKAAEKPNRSMASLHEYSDITDTARYNVSSMQETCFVDNLRG